jgi:hypothetical protein
VTVVNHPTSQCSFRGWHSANAVPSPSIRWPFRSRVSRGNVARSMRAGTTRWLRGGGLPHYARRQTMHELSTPRQMVRRTTAGRRFPADPPRVEEIIAVMRAATRTSGSRASICRASTPRRSSARSTDAQRQRCRRRRRFRIGSDRFGGHGNEHFVHAKAEARATRRKAPARRPQRAWRARAPCSSVDRSMAALVHRGREELSAHG